LAPALVIGALGASAGAPMVLVFTFDSVMLFTLVPLMMALGGTERIDRSSLVKAIARRIFLHPVIIATLVGLVVATINLRPPALVGDTIAFLSSAAAPGALFLVGVVMARQPVAGLSLETPLLLTVKLLVHPLIVYLLLSWIGGFERTWVVAAVLMAALPPAANLVGIARRYDCYVDQSATATVIGLFASLVTVTAVLWMILHDAIPVAPFD
jgi:predicted permease